MRMILAASAVLMGAWLVGQAQAAPAYRVEVVAQGFDKPWSAAFLYGGDILITELPGRLRLIRKGRLVARPIDGVPAFYYAGQGGLMDVVAHPNYKRNRWIYLSYASGDGSANATRVMRARFTGTGLEDQKVIF